MSDLVARARLAPSVGPFTIRRLMFRAGIFSADGYSADEVRRALPWIRDELREILSPDEFTRAVHDLDSLLEDGPSAPRR